MASRIKSWIIKKKLRIAVISSESRVLGRKFIVKICAKICACGSLNVFLPIIDQAGCIEALDPDGHGYCLLRAATADAVKIAIVGAVAFFFARRGR